MASGGNRVAQTVQACRRLAPPPPPPPPSSPSPPSSPPPLMRQMSRCVFIPSGDRGVEQTGQACMPCLKEVEVEFNVEELEEVEGKVEGTGEGRGAEEEV